MKGAMRRFWWAGACATCCWGALQRISTWLHRRGRRNCCGCFRAPTRWVPTSGWCWCMRAELKWRWRPSAATSNTAMDGIPTAVHFETDPRQDVLRRDFTINALLEAAIAVGQAGRFWISSVAGRIWRPRSFEPSAIRSARFREDHLRLLRAVRFAARLGFEIEAGDRSLRSDGWRR